MKFKALNDTEIDLLFEKAYMAISQADIVFKQDTLLSFYAYYKHASKDFNIDVRPQTNNGLQLVNAFKMNALFQVRHLSIRDCKIKYIELAILHLGEGFLEV